MNELKNKLYAYCEEYVTSRITRIKKDIVETQRSANEETKSSAGDKYETGRAMAQLEIEKGTKQLAEIEKLQHQLSKIDPEKTTTTIQAGSLVHTDKAVFYFSISIGQVSLESQPYFIVSLQSPIGAGFTGKKEGDQVRWNNVQYTITHIQ